MRSPSPDPWFRSSERDLGMARHLLGAGFYEGVAFHSQQAAEKILKGLLISRHCLWQRTHSCAELLAALARLGDTLPEGLLGAAADLDRHYLKTRYPSGTTADAGPYTAVVAEQALVTAETIAAFVKKRLPQGPTPGPRTCGPGEVREARATRSWGADSGVIHGFVSALAAGLPVKTLVLMGSRARGSHSPDSDYDFVLVSDCFTDLEPAERRVRPYRAWSATGSECDADIFCLAPTELVAMSDPLLWDALEEGTPILDDGAWAAAVTEFHRLRAAGRLVAVEDGWLFAPAPASPEQPHRFHRPVGDDAVEPPAEGGR